MNRIAIIYLLVAAVTLFTEGKTLIPDYEVLAA